MNPIALSNQVEQRYKRYLRTLFYFRDPALRASFERALDSGNLSKGPYLEATPIFKRAGTPRSLFSNLLGYQPDAGFLKAVQEDRPLYKHQEQAIHRVFHGNNVIVATGTGSGKTESFLYPILLHLYREFRAGELCPGVRALILYPMNALANDQRERLGSIGERLVKENSRFRFTFGQYIGETPEDENDTSRHARDHIRDRLPGELVLRSEIRNTPPHILLTNYSMLEYLLLRPADSPLFDDGQARWWTFLVLDEAHQYRGSRGIEMGMLLRRFKQRLREGGRSQPFRCIATSATLAGGEADKGSVAKFAADLFGEKFKEEDVILGETEPLPDIPSQRLGLQDYAVIQKELSTNRANKSDARRIGQILTNDARSSELRRIILSGPMLVPELANRVFNDLPAESRLEALTLLVQLLVFAEDPTSGAPLVSARYHIFLKSLEGAFLQFIPEKKILLDRGVSGDGYAVFEIALCRECGQHYLVAQKNFKGGKVAEPIRDASQEKFGATFLRPLDKEQNGEEDQDNVGEKADTFALCVECGEMDKTKPRCSHSHTIRVIRETSKDDDRADQIKSCGVCGYTASGRDPVKEMVYGADGPHAVIATTMYQHLDREKTLASAEGREESAKVLAFADGRQEAAFFAWYLDKSYQDILSRNTILRVVRSFAQFPDDGVSLNTMADRAFQKYRDAFKEHDSDDELTIRQNIWRAIYREFLSDEQRLSLEGVGLVRWSVCFPVWFKIPELLLNPPWSLTEREARDLVRVLLDSMRADHGVEIETADDVSLNWRDLDIQGTPHAFRIGQPKGRTDMRSWDGGKTRRVRFLSRLLSLPEQQVTDEAVKALRAIWQALAQADDNAPNMRDRLLIPVGDARRLSARWWRLHLTDARVYQCDTCARIQPVSLRGICARNKCRGMLNEISPSQIKGNHYRILYEESLPNSMVVEEHTAQLSSEKAREFQKAFRSGKIHVLSCSTTFELGVDLGDLDTTFLRNVPPESFNYAQRVGRVGRRSGRPGFALTYCRRNPHDLYHFANPLRMLSGRVQPPVLSLQNGKILSRHIAAVALSVFFRHYRERFGTVTSLFGDVSTPTLIECLGNHLKTHRSALENSLRAIVPPKMTDELGLGDGTWIDEIVGDEQRLTLAVAEISSDYQSVQKLRMEAFEKGDDWTVKWAGDRAKTIAGEEVLAFLSRKAVIPKYGFPVDVVELDTQRAQANQEAYAVSLQRDLTIAISEFAPSSELIANKKVWTSYGLKKVAEKEWERWWYVRCPTCGLFRRKKFENESTPPEFVKCCDRMPAPMLYIEPRFGFVTNRDKPKEPQARPVRVFSTRPYFAGFKEKEGEKIELGFVTLTKVSPGYMVVASEGRHGSGFFVCDRCGAGFRDRSEFQKGHETPFGQKCSARAESLKAVSLGHELVTDIMKLQFLASPMGISEIHWFAFALGYALVEGAAESLDVPSTDLNATVAYSEVGGVPPIILYDNVPGGAGLVARLEEPAMLQKCLAVAQKRVSGICGCGEDTSCYGCLRHYRNQFAHQHLKRGLVNRYLMHLLAEIPHRDM